MFLLGFIGILISALLNGIVLIKLWKWFIVPLGVMPITFWHALGIAGIISYLTRQYIPAKENDLTREIVTSITYSGLALLFGWIYHSFM